MVRVAAVGTASTGKSALLNALFGTRFPVDARAGSTNSPIRAFANFEGKELEVIDTPPLDHHRVPVDADVFLLVCDKDLTYAEYAEALRVSRAGRPLLCALNKADTYSDVQRRQLLSHVGMRLHGLVAARRIVTCAADPVRIADEVQPDGSVVERLTPARRQVEEILPVLHEAIDEARTSLRVQTREYARAAAGRVRSAASSGWRKLRDRRRDRGT